jgi:uncharacterized damage-inducible protein DinB
MAINQSLLPEFDHEMGTTRRVLERVPEDKLGWKPHEKSFTFGRLAGHIAEMTGWGSTTLTSTEFDVAPPGSPAYQPHIPASTKEIMDKFDAGVKDLRAAIAGASDAALMEMWSLKMGGQTMFSMPRVAVLRSMIMNHIIHHRGQLSLYLRMNDVPVPAIYGPSADEQAPMG